MRDRTSGKWLWSSPTYIRVGASPANRHVWASMGLVATVLAMALSPSSPQAPALAAPDSSYNVGDAAFLKGTYIQVGVAGNGRFGTRRSDGASVPPGKGFFPNVGLALGFRADRDRNGTFDDGDFFLPGGDFEGWAIRANGTNALYDNSNNLGAGSLSTVEVTSSSMSVVHSINTLGLDVAQAYSVPIVTGASDGDQQLSVSVTITNPTANTITGVFFSRAVDPDNNQTQNCGYDTTQTIRAQYGVSGSTYSLVSATDPDSCLPGGVGPAGDESYIGLFSSDSRSSVGYWKSSFGAVPANSFVTNFDTSTFVYSVGSSTTTDSGMGLSLDLGDIAAGESVSFTYAYVMSSEAAAQAVAAATPSVPAGEPGDREVSVSWDQPYSANPIIGYRVRYSVDNGATWTPYGSDFQGDVAPRELTVSGLTNGTEYKFQVVALTGTNTLTSGVYSSATEGSWSGSSIGVIPGAPTAPTIDSIASGNQKLTVAFTAPAFSGGFAITNYEYSTDDGATWTAAGSVSSPLVIAGLNNGGPYQVKLRALNSNNTGIASSATSGTPAATVPGPPSIAGISPTSQSLSVVFSAPGDDGGSSITNYQYSTDGTNYRALSPAQVTSPIVITFLSSDGTTPLVNGTAYPVTIKAVNLIGSSAASNSVNSTPNVPAPTSTGGGVSAPASTPQPTVTTPVTTPVNPRVLPRKPLSPAVLQGPILRGNVPPAPPSAPLATVGGRITPTQTQITSPTGFSLRAGVLNLGLQVQQDQGVVRQNNTGGTEIEVRKGSTAAMSGTGLLPRSTVQVFLPLQGSNAKEVARIPVDETGSFSGDAVFATRANERPLPIGRQVMQIVSLDEDGQQSVVEMTVNIAQSAPAPEPDRTAGATPTLRPGQFLATNAGEPEIVTVVPVPEDRQARVEGDGWQMAVDIPSANGSVAPSDEGGALLQLVRDETAVVSGSGFMPGTRADVWLFSEPTLLGTVDIDENGEFSGDVNIDANVVAIGEHTLQLQGVGEDGYVRAANLGVVVNDTAAEATTEEAAGGFLWWLWLLVILVALILWFVIWRYRRNREA